MKRVWVLLAVMVVSCTSAETRQPTFTVAPSLAPSPTVLPLVSPESPETFLGRSDPTAAALAAEGEPSLEPAFLPQPTEASIPITVLTADGDTLEAAFYGAAVRPSPAVLLLADAADVWLGLVAGMQSAGYNVMLMYLLSPSDAAEALAAIDTLLTLPSVNGLLVAGEGKNALPALVACSQRACRALILLNPLPNEAVLPLKEALATQIASPIFVAVGSDNAPAVQMAEQIGIEKAEQSLIKVYPTSIFEQTALLEDLKVWLAALP